MKKPTKIISLSLSCLLVIGLLLSMAIGAKAAPKTLTGLLAAGATPNEWTVNGEPVYVDASTVCSNVASCSALAAGMLVTVVKDDTTNIASTISVLGHFEGTISGLANGNTTWTVKDDQGNAFDFTVSADLWPLVFGVGDRVAITFTFENGDLVASAVQVLETAVPVKTEFCGAARMISPTSRRWPNWRRKYSPLYRRIPDTPQRQSCKQTWWITSARASASARSSWHSSTRLIANTALKCCSRYGRRARVGVD